MVSASVRRPGSSPIAFSLAPAACVACGIAALAPRSSADICSIVFWCAPAGSGVRTWTSTQAGVDPDAPCTGCASALSTDVPDSHCEAAGSRGSAHALSSCDYPAPVQFRLECGGQYLGGPVSSGAIGFAAAGVGTRWIIDRPGMSGTIRLTVDYRLTVARSGSGPAPSIAMRSNLFQNGLQCVLRPTTIGSQDYSFPAIEVPLSFPFDYLVGVSAGAGGVWTCAPCGTDAQVSFSLSDIHIRTQTGAEVTGFTIRDANTGDQIWPQCIVDLNGDGLLDFTDYLEFLNLYDALDLRADLNGDGLIDFSDYLEFLNLYEAGC